jgi:hypothetical protein
MEIVPPPSKAAWVVRLRGTLPIGYTPSHAAARVERSHLFRIEGGSTLDGFEGAFFLRHEATGAYLNYMGGHTLRGHGSKPNNEKAAGKEASAKMDIRCRAPLVIWCTVCTIER